MAHSDKVGRTVRLSSDINQRLLDLCDHLGVNPNAYLVAEIGKAVARDEVTFRAKSQQAEFFNRLTNEVVKGISEMG